MGRTWKRDPNGDDFDDLTSIDEDDDRDLIEWMTRPNDARRDAAARRERSPALGRRAYRGLPDDWRDDWRDVDLAGDAEGVDAPETVWR